MAASEDTGMFLGDGYAVIIRRNDSVGAVEHLNQRLSAAVVNGDVHLLPSLYTHRAVWYMHQGMTRKAIADLNSAKKMQLTPEASAEVSVLLATCFQKLKKAQDAAAEVEQLKAQLTEGAVVSALVLRQVLQCTIPPVAAAPPSASTVTPPATPPPESAAPPSKHSTPSAGNSARVASAATPPSTLHGSSPATSTNGKAQKPSVPAQNSNRTAELSQDDKRPSETPAPKSERTTQAPSQAKSGPSKPAAPASRPAASSYLHTTIEEITEEGDGGLEGGPQGPPALEQSSPNASATLAAAGMANGGDDADAFASLGPEMQQLLLQHGFEGTPMTARQQQQMIEATAQLDRCIQDINSGKLDAAESSLTALLKERPKSYQALVARGTCRALKSDLKRAEADFSAAIDILPGPQDAYKRRSQTRGALGNLQGALADINIAIEKAPRADETGRAEALYERAVLHQKLRDVRAARRDLEAFIASPVGGQNIDAINMAALCVMSMGDLDAATELYRRALRIDPGRKESWIHMFQCYKEAGNDIKALQAFKKVQELDGPAERSVHVYRMRAHMLQCLGRHADAARLLNDALAPIGGKRVAVQRIECLHLRGACMHALGLLREAYNSYDAVQDEALPPRSLPETRGFQALSYYQREMCVYMQRMLDKDVLHFCLDRDHDPVFKESWAKQVLPSPQLVTRCPALLKSGKMFPRDPSPLPQMPLDAELKPLLDIAAVFGGLLQYTHQGFLTNQRQQRAAGIAAVELAQRVLGDLRARAGGGRTYVASDGASVGGKKAVAEGTSHEFGWRDAMDVVVRWRQLAEPNDQVLWVDMLTDAEFARGFGSHTPMFTGQTKCVRYYMNFARGLDVFRGIVLEQGYVVDARDNKVEIAPGKQTDAIRKAKTAAEMHAAIGTDCWVIVPIRSVSRAAGKDTLEGTRLTVTALRDQPDGHEFSIRTPVTPARWKDFDKELAACWNAICDAYLANDRSEAAKCILRYAYYWYNFMPLARGSAAVGYTTILSLFWAFGMPISVNIPADYQTDWQAILAKDPDDFIAAMSKWMLPPAAAAPAQGFRNEAVEARLLARNPEPDDNFPDALRLLGTLRKRIYALNHGTDISDLVGKRK